MSMLYAYARLHTTAYAHALNHACACALFFSVRSCKAYGYADAVDGVAAAVAAGADTDAIVPG